MTAGSEVAILSRVIEPGNPLLSPDIAQLILQWEFHPDDRQHMHELLERAKAGKLTPQEKAVAENYERVGHFISLLKAKARASLEKPSRST